MVRAVSAVVILIVVLPLLFVWGSLEGRAPVGGVNPETGRYIQLDVVNKQKAERRDPRKPKAVVRQTEFDFGVMNPNNVRAHTFQVFNAGQGPLTLRGIGTTCQCTSFKVLDHTVAPGQSGRIKVQWESKIEEGEEVFRHGGTVLTNDPDLPHIEFRVVGRVTTVINAQPPELVFGAIAPDQTGHASTVIYSQLYDQFWITDVKSSLPGLQWEVQPAPAQTLQELETRCAYQLICRAPPDSAEGPFMHWVRMRIVPEEGSQEAETLEIAAVGRVEKRLAVFGAQVDNRGQVNIGHVRPGQGARVKLRLRVRDARDPELRVTNVATSPDFISVSLDPHSGHTAGLYFLEIDIPPDAPVCHYDNARTGKLIIEFDHPRINPLTLNLRFAVYDSKVLEHQSLTGS